MKNGSVSNSEWLYKLATNWATVAVLCLNAYFIVTQSKKFIVGIPSIRKECLAPECACKNKISNLNELDVPGLIYFF